MKGAFRITRHHSLLVALGVFCGVVLMSGNSLADVEALPAACAGMEGPAAVECVNAFLASDQNEDKDWMRLEPLGDDANPSDIGWARRSELAVPSTTHMVKAGVPTLFLDCRSGAAWGFVHWDFILPGSKDASYVIGISTDNGPYRFRTWKRWEASTLVPAPAWLFFEELRGRTRVDVVLRFPIHPEVKARFNLAGIDNVLTDLAEHCPAGQVVSP